MWARGSVIERAGRGARSAGSWAAPLGRARGWKVADRAEKLSREVRKGEEEVAGWAGREGVGRASWVVFLLFFPFLFSISKHHSNYLNSNSNLNSTLHSNK